MLDYSLRGDVAVLTMDDQKANALSHDMLDALDAALDRAEREAKALVIAGREGKFCAGFDLTTMMAGPESAAALLTKGGAWLLRLYAFPLPVVAACSGHALAGGALLLLCCDLRIGVEGAFKIGLNEVQIGMTMHHVGIELARNRLRKSYFNRSVINAEMFDPAEAVAAGFLDAVVAPDELMGAARVKADELKKINMTAHANTKLKARKEFLETLDASIELDKQPMW